MDISKFFQSTATATCLALIATPTIAEFAEKVLPMYVLEDGELKYTNRTVSMIEMALLMGVDIDSLKATPTMLVEDKAAGKVEFAYLSPSDFEKLNGGDGVVIEPDLADLVFTSDELEADPEDHDPIQPMDGTWEYEITVNKQTGCVTENPFSETAGSKRKVDITFSDPWTYNDLGFSLGAALNSFPLTWTRSGKNTWTGSFVNSVVTDLGPTETSFIAEFTVVTPVFIEMRWTDSIKMPAVMASVVGWSGTECRTHRERTFAIR